MSDNIDLFKSIFTTSIQASIVIDAKGTIKEYNRAAEQLFKYTQAEMIGKNIKKLMSSATLKKYDTHAKNYKKTSIIHSIRMNLDVEMQRKDGSLLYVFLAVSEVKPADNELYSVVINDITQERMLREQNKKLIEFNLAIIKDVEAIHNYNDLIDNILMHFSKLFDFEVGHFYQYNYVEKHLESSNLFFTNHPKKYHNFVEITRKTTFKKGIGLPGSAWKKQSPVYYSDIKVSKNFPRQQLSKKPLHLTGGLALPVKYNEKLLGVIEFFSNKVLDLTKNDIDLIEKFSRIINGLYGQYQESRILSLLLDNCGEGIYGLDTEGITTFVNPRACEILGYEADELIGYSMHKKVHHSHHDGSVYVQADCHIMTSIKHNKPSHVEDEVFWNKAGQAVPIEYTVAPVIENKNIVGGVISFWDVSEKRKTKKYLDVITNIQRRYIQLEDKATIFDDILLHLLDITDSDYGFIAEIKQDLKDAPYLKTCAIINLTKNKAFDNFYEQHSANGLAFRDLKTLFGSTAKTGKVVISNKLAHEKRRDDLPKGHPELSSYLGIPLVGLNGELIAMYGVANCKHGYTQHLVDELKPLTQAVANIIESSLYYAEIEKAAKFDTLTSLFNRRFAHIKLGQLVDKHRKEKTNFCILILDLNNFKFVNDMYGTRVGDALLIAFSKRISGLIKSCDFFARVGGNEFIVLIESTRKPKDVIEISSSLSKANDVPYKVHGKSISCGLSMGVACYPMGGKTREELLNHVHFALYDAKRKKERIGFYSKKTKVYFEEIMMLESDFKQAFSKKEFFIEYQPQVDLNTGIMVGMEALVRWRHPRRGLLYPDAFIEHLENLGQSEQLNIYVLEKVLAEASGLDLDIPFNISINISPKVSDFKKHIHHLVKVLQSKEATLRKDKLTFEFEITESSFISHTATTLHRSLLQATHQGIRCAIDDFGMEYSSINRLTQYKFDTVKIDKVFTQQLDKRNKKSTIAIINALVQLSNDLNFKLIAEGPETEAQVKQLLDVGCFYGQGYYFHKPMPLKKILKLIKKSI